MCTLQDDRRSGWSAAEAATAMSHGRAKAYLCHSCVQHGAAVMGKAQLQGATKLDRPLAGRIAERLAQLAHAQAADPDSETPWMTEAAKARMHT